MKKENKEKKKGRIIGLDMHPDTFTAALLCGADPGSAVVEKVVGPIAQAQLEIWAKKYWRAEDRIVLEASDNSFEVVKRLEAIGLNAVVVESRRAGQIRNAACNDDRSSAVKLARLYLTGLAHEVWRPDEKTRSRRELFLIYEKAVTQSTRLRNRIKSFLNEHCVRLGKRMSLTRKTDQKRILKMHTWSELQQQLLESLFEELIQAEQRRKQWKKLMAAEVSRDEHLIGLMRILGVREVVAFAIGAIIGDVRRFSSPKKMVGYLGLAPSRKQSGEGDYRGGLSHCGRKDLRNLLIQSAHCILRQPNSPLHAWAIKLFFRKANRNIAAAAVARKLAVSIWYLMKGYWTPLTEIPAYLEIKIRKLATTLGKAKILEWGYRSPGDFVQEKLRLLQSLSLPKPMADG